METPLRESDWQKCAARRGKAEGCERIFSTQFTPRLRDASDSDFLR
jgi:hypothetical protein